MKHSDIEEAWTETFSYVEKEKGNLLSFTTGCKELLEKNLHDTIDMTPSPIWNSIASGQYLSQLGWDFWQALPLMKGLCVCEAHSLCSHNAVFLCTHFFKDQSFLIINGSEWIQWNSYHFKDFGSKAPLSFSCFSLPCLPETSHHHLSVKGVDNLRPDFPMSQTACQSWTTLQKSSKKKTNLYETGNQTACYYTLQNLKYCW